MSELHKLMKHYFDLNGCYIGNEYWSKLIEKAIKTDEAESEVSVEAIVKPANDVITNIKHDIDYMWEECYDSELSFTVEQMDFIAKQVANIKRRIDNRLSV